jgi:hypothetical protein
MEVDQNVSLVAVDLLERELRVFRPQAKGSTKFTPYSAGVKSARPFRPQTEKQIKGRSFFSPALLKIFTLPMASLISR